MQNAYKYEDEYSSIHYVVKQDKHLKRKLRKEFKDTCRIVALVWLMCLAFIIPVFIPNQTIGNVYALLMFGAAVLQLLGW